MTASDTSTPIPPAYERLSELRQLAVVGEYDHAVARLQQPGCLDDQLRSCMDATWLIGLIRTGKPEGVERLIDAFRANRVTPPDWHSPAGRDFLYELRDHTVRRAKGELFCAYVHWLAAAADGVAIQPPLSATKTAQGELRNLIDSAFIGGQGRPIREFPQEQQRAGWRTVAEALFEVGVAVGAVVSPKHGFADQVLYSSAWVPCAEEAVALALSKGADVNYIRHQGGSTPYVRALRQPAAWGNALVMLRHGHPVEPPRMDEAMEPVDTDMTVQDAHELLVRQIRQETADKAAVKVTTRKNQQRGFL